MSVKTIEFYFNNTQNSSESVNNQNQTNNKLKNRQKKNHTPIHNYLKTLEDGTRICKVCDKDKGVVENAVKQCNVCVTQCATKQMPAMKPIIAKKFLAYIQINTINITAIPDNKFKYIIYIRDHFTRYSVAKLATSKSAKEAASFLLKFCLIFGPPLILHLDNGGEFVGN
ncbi:1480_t:CDS:2, partial [Dentiscutata erythropus]